MGHCASIIHLIISQLLPSVSSPLFWLSHQQGQLLTFNPHCSAFLVTAFRRVLEVGKVDAHTAAVGVQRSGYPHHRGSDRSCYLWVLSAWIYAKILKGKLSSHWVQIISSRGGYAAPDLMPEQCHRSLDCSV